MSMEKGCHPQLLANPYAMEKIPWLANPSTMATMNSRLSLDGPWTTVNCQVSWSVNNGYILLNHVVWIDNWSEQYPVGDWECSIPGLSFCHSRTRTSPFPPITSEPTAPPIGRRNTSRSDYADLVILKGGGGWCKSSSCTIKYGRHTIWRHVRILQRSNICNKQTDNRTARTILEMELGLKDVHSKTASGQSSGAAFLFRPFLPVPSPPFVLVIFRVVPDHWPIPSMSTSFVGHWLQNAGCYLVAVLFDLSSCHRVWNITSHRRIAPPNTTRSVPCTSHFLSDRCPVDPKRKPGVFGTGHVIDDEAYIIYTILTYRISKPVAIFVIINNHSGTPAPTIMRWFFSQDALIKTAVWPWGFAYHSSFGLWRTVGKVTDGVQLILLLSALRLAWILDLAPRENLKIGAPSVYHWIRLWKPKHSINILPPHIRWNTETSEIRSLPANHLSISQQAYCPYHCWWYGPPTPTPLARS